MPLPGLELPGRVSTKPKHMNTPVTNLPAETVNPKPVYIPDFPVRLAKAMSHFCSRDQTRYALTFLHFEYLPDSSENVKGSPAILIAATDGTSLGVYVKPTTCDPFAPFNLPVTWLPHFKTNQSVDILISDSHRITRWEISNPIIGVTVWGEDNYVRRTYPNWRRVVPEPDKPLVPESDWNYNHNVINKFADFAKVMGLKHKHLRILHHEELGHWSVFVDDEQFYGVCMPVRKTNDVKIPKWAR